MSELQLSIIDPAQTLEPLVRELCVLFEAEYMVKVQVHRLGWEKAWAQLVSTALNGGFDVSQVGSTWLNSLVTMNVLRPFTVAEAAAFGGPEAFVRSSWNSNFQPGDDRLWAAPLSADTRILYYRRDLLAEAGVAEDQASDTP
jgi:multiple sugar transport system substrate-binding protein